jgi:hypothetical protein
MNMWDHIPREAVDLEIECHSCGHTMSGYQMGELVVEHGWRLHSVGLGRPLFVMCGECEAEYGERRAA